MKKTDVHILVWRATVFFFFFFFFFFHSYLNETKTINIQLLNRMFYMKR